MLGSTDSRLAALEEQMRGIVAVNGRLDLIEQNLAAVSKAEQFLANKEFQEEHDIDTSWLVRAWGTS